MKFYKPQVELAKIVDPTLPTEYVLHSVIFCRYTNFKANGHEVDLSDLEDESLVTVTLKLDQDENAPEFEYITPVVHTINLGAINFPEGDGWIEIDVEGAVIEEGGARAETPVKKSTKPGTKATVSTVDADTKTRPGDQLN